MIHKLKYAVDFNGELSIYTCALVKLLQLRSSKTLCVSKKWGLHLSLLKYFILIKSSCVLQISSEIEIEKCHMVQVDQSSFGPAAAARRRCVGKVRALSDRLNASSLCESEKFIQLIHDKHLRGLIFTQNLASSWLLLGIVTFHTERNFPFSQ